MKLRTRSKRSQEETLSIKSDASTNSSPKSPSEHDDITAPSYNYSPRNSCQNWPKELNACTSSITVSQVQSYSASTSLPILRKQLRKDGYLVLRNILPRSSVIQSRNIILEDMWNNGFVPSADSEEIMKDDTEKSRIAELSLLSRQDLARHPKILNMLEYPPLFDLVADLLESDVEDEVDNDDKLQRKKRKKRKISDQASRHSSIADNNRPSKHPKPISPHPLILTIPFKWLRAVPTNLCTGPHLDVIKMQSPLDFFTNLSTASVSRSWFQPASYNMDTPHRYSC